MTFGLKHQDTRKLGLQRIMSYFTYCPIISNGQLTTMIPSCMPNHLTWLKYHRDLKTFGS